MTLAELNDLTKEDAEKVFLSCCHSQAWAGNMSNARPFDSVDALLHSAEIQWDGRSEKDTLDAFSGHPKIGDLNALRNKYANDEQGQIVNTQDHVLEKLRHLNEEYEKKFGFIFIVFATGKSAEEMLSLLESRFPNSREEELINGAREQQKITHLRLKKLVETQ